MNVPSEYRVRCGRCGFSGGVYDPSGGRKPPGSCPVCRGSVGERGGVDVIDPEDEPPSEKWRG